MKGTWMSAALVSGYAMLMALSACSGTDPKEITDDVDDYCASVEGADEICHGDPGSPQTSNGERAGVDAQNAERARAVEQPGNPGLQTAGCMFANCEGGRPL